MASGNTLSATLPANAVLAPPGFYMLFLVSVGGTPSTAVWIGMGGAVPKTRVNITDAGGRPECPLPCLVPRGLTQYIWCTDSGSHMLCLVSVEMAPSRAI